MAAADSSSSSSSSKQISLRVMVDKESNRVVFAESDGDFVDILFSFLTMPMGTIIRLLNKQSQPATIGSFTSLYQGVVDFSTENLWTESCKSMLLHPKNSAETLIKNLKLNIDDTESTRYFVSSNICAHLSTFKDITCPCRNSMDEEILCEDDDSSANGLGGVFVKPGAMFIISDDFQVLPASYDAILSLLNNLGIKDMEMLVQKTLNVGLEEIHRILALSLLSKSTLTDVLSLISKSTLTDVFLGCQDVNSSCTNLGSIKSKDELETANDGKKISVKLIIQKVDNKVLYAESTEDFIDLLFSFLTVPLGSVEELLGGRSSLKCIDNLYKSVGDLYVDRFVGSNHHKELLLSPKLPLSYLCNNQVLDVKEVNVMPQLGIENFYNPKGRIEVKKYLTFMGKCLPGYSLRSPTLLDPKASIGNTASDQGYVKGQATFMVTDDLVVTPLSSISSICLLKSLNADISSIEKRVISVGEKEALSLLKASLYSNSALTIGLNSFQKQESCFSWLEILSKWINVKN